MGTRPFELEFMADRPVACVPLLHAVRLEPVGGPSHMRRLVSRRLLHVACPLPERISNRSRDQDGPSLSLKLRGGLDSKAATRNAAPF